jgi:hypothetical protein
VGDSSTRGGGARWETRLPSRDSSSGERRLDYGGETLLRRGNSSGGGGGGDASKKDENLLQFKSVKSCPIMYTFHWDSSTDYALKIGLRNHFKHGTQLFLMMKVY